MKLVAALAAVALAAAPAERLPTALATPAERSLSAALAEQTPAAAVREPVVTVAPSTAAVGDRMTVRLAGWPAGNVVVELCHDGPEPSSESCAFGASAQTYARPDGTGLALLTATAPPGGCPCLVRVRSLTGTLSRTAEIALTGVRVAPPAPTGAAPVLTVVGVTVHGGLSWSALFGGPVRRTVTIAVRATGDRPPGPVTLSVTAGRGGAPTGMVVVEPLTGLAAGADVRHQVPVRFSAPTGGTYTVRGEIAADLGPPIAFEAETTTQPWGLTAVLAAALVGFVVHRGRSRRRAE